VIHKTRAQTSAAWSLMKLGRWREGRWITDNVYKVLAVSRSITPEVTGSSRTPHCGVRAGCTGCSSGRGELRLDPSRFSQTDGLAESATTTLHTGKRVGQTYLVYQRLEGWLESIPGGRSQPLLGLLLGILMLSAPPSVVFS
jgi:hypothetical protein